MASAAARPSHQRTLSSTSTKSNTKAVKNVTPEPTVHYTTLIRLPFPRNGFVDPTPIEWDAQRDRALWKIISRTSKTSDLDWDELASHFGVDAGFMLQQAAWLYERHLQHVRAQMRKIQPPASGAGSIGNVSSAGGYPMKRLGSGGSRAPSSLSVRARDSPVPRDTSGPSTPRSGAAPPLSRTTSTNTVTQSRVASSPRQPVVAKTGGRASGTAASKRSEVTSEIAAADETNPLSPESPSSPTSISSETSTSSSEEQEARPMRRSQLLKRPPRFGQKPKSTLARVEDDEGSDDEDSGLPFATNAQSTADVGVKNITEATPPVSAPRATTGSKGKASATQGATPPIESSTSSASSLAPTRNEEKKPGPISPHRRAELGRLNQRPKREGSEGGGTPSMGSSFSDLDDTSVTQSALEEALLSKMQHGAMSRMSNISNAFRSRYLG